MAYNLRSIQYIFFLRIGSNEKCCIIMKLFPYFSVSFLYGRYLTCLYYNKS